MDQGRRFNLEAYLSGTNSCTKTCYVAWPSTRHVVARAPAEPSGRSCVTVSYGPLSQALRSKVH